MTCPRPLSCMPAFQRLREVSLEETIFLFRGARRNGLLRGWEWEGSQARDESQGEIQALEREVGGLEEVTRGGRSLPWWIQLIPLGLENVTGAQQRLVRSLLQPGFPQDLLAQRIPGGSGAGRRSLQQAPACRDRERNCWVQVRWRGGPPVWRAVEGVGPGRESRALIH